MAPLCPGGRTPRRRQRHASEVDLEIEYLIWHGSAHDLWMNSVVHCRRLRFSSMYVSRAQCWFSSFLEYFRFVHCVFCPLYLRLLFIANSIAKSVRMHLASLNWIFEGYMTFALTFRALKLYNFAFYLLQTASFYKFHS